MDKNDDFLDDDHFFAEWLTGEKCLGVQRFSPSQISDTPRAGFQSAQNLSSDYHE